MWSRYTFALGSLASIASSMKLALATGAIEKRPSRRIQQGASLRRNRAQQTRYEASVGSSANAAMLGAAASLQHRPAQILHRDQLLGVFFAPRQCELLRQWLWRVEAARLAVACCHVWAAR